MRKDWVGKVIHFMIVLVLSLLTAFLTWDEQVPRTLSLVLAGFAAGCTVVYWNCWWTDCHEPGGDCYDFANRCEEAMHDHD